VARAAERGVRIGQWHPSRVRAVTHLDAPPEAVLAAADTLAHVLAEVLA
jgi:threonine aldolase